MNCNFSKLLIAFHHHDLTRKGVGDFIFIS